MKIKWTPLAIAHLDYLYAYIAQDNPVAAKGVFLRIQQAADLLKEYPHMAKKGRRSDVRELLVQKTPYVVAYSIREERIEILAVFHQAQQWPDVF